MQNKHQPSKCIGERLFCLHLSSLRTVSLLLTLLLLLSSGGISLASNSSNPKSMVAVPLVVSSASEYDYPPYCIVKPDHQADGFSVELLRAALKAMGRDVSFQVGPWGEVKQLLTDGKVQVLPLVGRTPERELIYDFTFPYLTMHGTIVVHENENSIHGLADLKGKQVAVMRGDNAEEFLRRSNLETTIVTTTTFAAALQQLANGEHDAVIIQKLLALQLMDNSHLDNLKIVGPPLDDFVQSFCFAVTKGNQKLLGVLNEGLSIVIADGTFRHLHQKWFGPIEAFEAGKSRIVIGGDDSFPPYEFLDENGQPTGYNVELTRAIAKQIGIGVDIQLRPWGEVRRGLAENEIDATHGMFYSLERDAVFDFSPAHTVVSYVIAARENSELPQSMGALAGKSILVMEGDIMHDVAIKQGYEKQLVLVKSQVEALKQLANGQYDYALVAKIPALYWIQKNGWENLHISEQPLLSLEYCYAVPHGKNDLLARMSEGLSAIKATGEYREIYSRWLGVYEKPVFSLWEVLKYAFFIIVPIIIMLLGFVLWSWSLKGKVNRATAHLKDERQRLASIIAGTRAGTWEWNVQTGATRFNKEWAEMIGYTLEEITPVSIETWEKCVHPDDLQKCKDRLEEHFREDTDFYECEYRMKHKNGHWIWILDRGKVASRTNDEKPLWMFGTHLNITERMEAEAARNSINIQLEAQNNELEQVINVTSHDLRSPLVCIEGFSSVLGTSLEEILDILGKEKFSSETKEKLAPAFDRSRKSIDYISKSVAKMGLLLNGFLQVSRLGRVEIKTEELDMNALMSDVLSVFKFKSEEQGAKIEISDLPSCLGDEGQVNQLFTNLIANAFKYSASNRPGIIKISGQKEGNHIVYCVEDNGIGIAQEFQVKIFEMFHQLNPGTEGEGLGLCIVHKIAERHNGRAWVEAELGKGSRFYVSFPRA